MLSNLNRIRFSNLSHFFGVHKQVATACKSSGTSIEGPPSCESLSCILVPLLEGTLIANLIHSYFRNVHPGVFVSLYFCMCDVVFCVLKSYSVPLGYCNGAQGKPNYHKPAMVSQLRPPLESHRKSSNSSCSPKHQKSSKWIPNTSKTFKKWYTNQQNPNTFETHVFAKLLIPNVCFWSAGHLDSDPENIKKREL